MNLDERLTEAMTVVADLHEPPSPDLDRLLTGGRRRQRQRVVRRAAVAAMVVVILAAVSPLAVGALRQQQSVRPTAPSHQLVTDLPLGAPPAIPYCNGEGAISAAGVQIQTRCDVMIHRGDSTLLSVRQGLELLRGARHTLLDGHMWTAWFPAMSHDGRYAAWITARPHSKDAGDLLVFDLSAGRQIATVPVSSTDAWVPGIDDLGRVYVENFNGGSVIAYDIGSGRTIQVRGLPVRAPSSASIRFVTADGFAVETKPLSRDNLVGIVTDDGRFTNQRRVTQGWSTYSPDGSHLVQDTGHGLAVSAATGVGRPVVLQLPSVGGPTWHPVWESDDSVLVEFDPSSTASTIEWSNGERTPAGSTYLLRCFVSTGKCEVALQPGWSGRMRDPVYR